jgi:hypothetical protein
VNRPWCLHFRDWLFLGLENAVPLSFL